MRLSKQIGISWITASRMLRKIRIAMGHRDSLYSLQDLIEIDDALVGGRRSGKRGRGTEGKPPVLVAVENRGQRAGYIAMQQVSAVTKKSVAKFVQHHLSPGQQEQSPYLLSIVYGIVQTKYRMSRKIKKEWNAVLPNNGISAKLLRAI